MDKIPVDAKEILYSLGTTGQVKLKLLMRCFSTQKLIDRIGILATDSEEVEKRRKFLNGSHQLTPQ